MTTTTQISRADGIELADGRTGKVAWTVDDSELFALMGDRHDGRAELVAIGQIARVIPAK